MAVYNAGDIYLEDLSGGTSDQIHIYAQADNIADGAVSYDKLGYDVTGYFGDAFGASMVTGWDDGYILTNGTTVDVTAVQTSPTGYSHMVCQCSEGDTFAVYIARSSSTTRPYTFVAQDGTKLDQCEVIAFTGYATAPAGSYYAVFQSRDNPGKVYKVNPDIYPPNTAQLVALNSDAIYNVANVGFSSATLSMDVTYYINPETGARGTAGDRYSATVKIPVPGGCTRVDFPDAGFRPDTPQGWATYSQDADLFRAGYLRGGRTPYIEFTRDDKYYALSSYITGGAGTSIDVRYTFGEINETVADIEESIAGLRADLADFPALSLSGKKIVMLGDSLIGNYDGAGSIPYDVAAYTGAQCVNCAFGGSSMGSDLASPNQWLEPFNGWKVIRAITDGSWTEMQNTIDSDPQSEHLRPNYQAHLNSLKNMDWSTVDIITLSYGTNDWGTRVVLDDTDNPDSTDTFTGAYRTAIRTLLGTYPRIKVMAFGVVWRALSQDGGSVTSDSDSTKGGRNWWLREYEEAAETVCSELHIPFVKMYDYTCFNSMTWANYFGSDLTHPNATGRDVMAKRYAAHLIELP